MSGRLGNSIIEASGRYWLVPNLFVGGVGGAITDNLLLASELGIISRRCKNFNIDGEFNVSAHITHDFSQAQIKWRNNPSLTYYIDPTGRVTTINQADFESATNMIKIWIPNCTVITGPSGYSTMYNLASMWGYIHFPKLTTSENHIFNSAINITTLYMPEFTTLKIQNETRSAYSNMSGLDRCYLPKLSTVDYPLGQIKHFGNVKSGCIFYFDPLLETSDGGNREPLIVYLEDTRLCDIRYITDFTKPNYVTDLIKGTVTNNSIQLNFTPPSVITTPIEFYEVYIDDGITLWQKYLSYQELTNAGDIVSGLTSGTTYSIQIKTADDFYNISEFSNKIFVTTNGFTLDTSLISYWKMDDLEPNTFIEDSTNANHGYGVSVLTGVNYQINASLYTPTDGDMIVIPTTSGDFDIYHSGTTEGNFSISQWSRPPDAGVHTTWGLPIINREIDGNYSWNFKVNPVTRFLQLTIYTDASNYIQVIGHQPYSNGVFNHCVFTYNGNKNSSGIKLYLNGVLQTNSVTNVGTYTGMNEEPNRLVIGSHPVAGTRARSGWHDETKFWGREITQIDITEDYNQGVAGLVMAKFIPPNSISDLQTDNIYETYMEISWTEPTTENPIDYYIIYLDGGVYDTTNALNETILELTSGNTYNVYVKSVDIYTNISDISNELNITMNGVDPIYSLPLSNMISRYTFEDEIVDIEGTNDPNSIVGVTYSTGGVSKWGDFSNGEVTIPDSDDLSFTDGNTDLPFTISFLVQFDVLTNSWFVNKRDNTTSRNEWQIYRYQGLLGFTLFNYDASGYIGINATWTPNINQLYHVTATYDGSESDSGLKFYIDGVELSHNLISTGVYNGITNTASVVTLGTNGWGSALDLDGKMDEVIIWDKELNQTEITDLSTLQLAGTDINP